jgi:hypothetical protein
MIYLYWKESLDYFLVKLMNYPGFSNISLFYLINSLNKDISESLKFQENI